MKFKIFCLGLILLLASILRLWGLSSYPAGLNADEAAIGYNAYSLILTGKDEHGNSWPIHFKSFGDYKPGLYFYLVLPLVKILGLNVLAVRLPSAILGTLSVWLIYLLVKELFKNEVWGLLSAFFLAISPWHLHFSRGGWETNAATCLILLGSWLFFKGLEKPRFFVFSVLFYGLSFYTYHSARIIVPLLGLGLIFLYRKRLFQRKNRQWVLISGIVGFIILIPLIISFFGPAGISRFAGVGLLADTGPLWRINELRGHHGDTMALPVRLIHNRFIGYSIAFAKNWFDHLQGEYLFITGDVIERSRVPDMGQMYLFDILLVVLGIYFLLKKQPKNWLVVFLWLAVAPVAAAMTFQTPHALRSLMMVIPLIIISAYGFYQSWLWVKTKAKKPLVTSYWLLVAVVLLWSTTYYLHQYYVHYPKTYPDAWEYGFDQLVSYVQEVEGKYERIYVTDKYDQPYILFLFYLKYPPEQFQQEVKLTPRDKFGFSTVRDFDKYHFASINFEELKKQKNVLIIGTDKEIPELTIDEKTRRLIEEGKIPPPPKITKEIYFKDGSIAFQIVKT
ncbi:glycosyltransferase family 39 protein [Patescibacteria group bacterium]|nr:glycosyltransferase family 39 protein [Patescibacteria group bacterium]